MLVGLLNSKKVATSCRVQPIAASFSSCTGSTGRGCGPRRLGGCPAGWLEPSLRPSVGPPAVRRMSLSWLALQAGASVPRGLGPLRRGGGLLGDHRLQERPACRSVTRATHPGGTDEECRRSLPTSSTSTVEHSLRKHEEGMRRLVSHAPMCCPVLSSAKAAARLPVPAVSGRCQRLVSRTSAKDLSPGDACRVPGAQAGGAGADVVTICTGVAMRWVLTI